MTLATAATCIVIVLLLALVIAYTLVITSRAEPDPDPELLIDPQYCRTCGKPCKSTYCQQCQTRGAEERDA